MHVDAVWHLAVLALVQGIPVPALTGWKDQGRAVDVAMDTSAATWFAWRSAHHAAPWRRLPC